MAKTVNELATSYECQRIVEPFLGGGAVALGSTLPGIAGDINDDLMNLWAAVKRDPVVLDSHLREAPIDADHYNLVRCASPRKSLERAERLLYLNRTSWGGVYRVNAAGVYNVPFGFTFDRAILPSGRLESAAVRLRSIRLSTGDYSGLLNKVGPDDFVFLDPPYFSDGRAEGGYRRFTAEPFASSQTAELIDAALSLRESCRLMVVCLGGGPEGWGERVLKRERWVCITERRHSSGLVETVWSSRAPTVGS